ncbi:hypothetical protein FD755_005227 [Muntiacus reevesi]|uniref:FHA domain-containing protein n=1 Tax=Muntiacus reevesi TaxID=9886 RepID=A0A5J5MSN5_MUNRE|nr:hypothetical protein FD755_005227 [Muntiacus reevesi]
MGPARRLVTIKRSGVDGPHFPLSLSTCLFGRSIECDIRIQLPVVSKQHCKIEISEQEAVLFNFSSTNPTQINGSTFDKPVQLKHGDVITIVDRSFRYENESHQDASKSPGFPGQRREQETSRRVSRSSLSSNPEGKAQDSSACSEVREEAVSGRPVVHGEDVTAARAISGRGEDHVARRTASRVPSSELPGDNCRGATAPTAGDLTEDPRVASGACREDPKAPSSIQCLKRRDQSASPFRKLYESMKVELDANPGKGSVPQNRRKSGPQRHCTTGRESADGLQDETLVSPKSRWKSGRSPHMKADPGLGEQGSSQAEGEGNGEPVQTPKEPRSPGIARAETETRKTRTPVRCSPQTTTPLRCSPHSPSRRRRSEDPSVIGGHVSQSLDQSEGSGADDKTLTPQKFLPRNQTPVKVGSFGNTPEKFFSRKRKSMPANVDHLTAETEIPHPTISAPLILQVERKIQSDFLNKPEKLGPAAGQVGPGLSSLGAADVCSFGDSTNKMEGVAAKRRRVSFGGRLRPELFDENLPPNTPLKKGETPKQRRSLAAHTPTALKKIIKEQPQPSGKEDSSEVRLKVTSPDTLMSSPAPHAVHASAAAPDRCRRLSKVSCVSGVGGSPCQTDVPKRGGRRSSGLPAQKASLERSQHGILQTIFSRRRSGASEANLIVARSWADVVKLGAKQAQHKAAKRGPPRQPARRQRRANTPKKPPSTVHSQFSTGHANSPCTIVIGKAQLEKVTGPARPYRVINNFVVSKPRDFNEDLSGLPEMFKTPVKEKPQRMSMCPPTFPNSEDLLGKELPGPHSGEKPLLCTLENFGENVFPKTQDTAKGPSDQSSASPALRRPSIKMSEDTVKTPRSMNKTIAAEKKTPVSTAATPKATSSANRSRRSAELSGVQTPGTGPENQDAKPDPVEDILGKRLGKTPQPEPKLERDTKESEKSFEKCKQNIESKENSEKMIAVRRSRRTSELKCEPAADLTTGGQEVRRSGGRPPLQRSQDTEAEENQVDILSLLQTPGHAKEVMDAENRATKMSCKSPKPGAVRTPTRVSTQLKTPSQKVGVGGSSDLRKPSETPGKATPTQREPRDAKSIQLFKETPKQKLDPAENSAGSKRRPRTPKGKAPPLEDLTGFSELFQTPDQAKEPMTDDKTTKTPCKSQPEPVNPPSRRGHLRTPSQKVNVQEGLSALRKPQQTPGKATWSPGEPEGGDSGISVSQEAPEEKLDLAGKVPSGKRRPRTPKGKAQSLEDLTGFKELFQTPDQAKEPMTDDKTTKTPCKSPQLEPVNTPSRRGGLRTPSQKVDVEEELSSLRKPQQTPRGTRHSDREPADGDEDINVSSETLRQEMDPTDYVTGIKRQSRTPIEDVQSLEDLTGFRELFQSPVHTKVPRAIVKNPKMLGQSPQLKPVNITPTRRGHLRTPSQKMDLQEDLSALRKPQQIPGKTTWSPREPEGGDRDIAVAQEAPEEKLDLAENVPATKRRSRTPRGKTPLLEDLAGFKELFQTPHQAKETMANDKPTTIPCKSPAQPVNTPTHKKRRLKSPPRKVGIEGELSVLRRPAQTPGGARHSEGEAAGDGEDIKAFTGTPRQKSDPAENVTGIKRQLRTPKEKVQSLEDLTGFRELFQTPDHTTEPRAILKTPQMLCTSSQPELIVTPTSRKRQPRTPLGKMDTEKELSVLRRPTRASGQTMHTWCREPGDDDKSSELFKETPKQKLDPAENSAGSKRRPRTPKGKAPPLEDLTGFKELFQTPDQAKEPMTDDKTTKTPCKSPQPEPVNTPSRRGHLRTPSQKVNEPMTDDKTTKTPYKSPAETINTPASKKRRLKSPPRKVGIEEELSVLRRPAHTLGGTRHSEGEAAGDGEDIKAFTGTPRQKSDPAENVTGIKRQLRTPKEKVQSLEDLTGFRELFQTPDHTKEPRAVLKTPKMFCQSPSLEPVNIPPGRRGSLRIPSQKVDMQEDRSALRKPTQTPGMTTHLPKEPKGGDRSPAVSQETPEEKPDPAENLIASKWQPRTPQEKAQLLEDLDGFKELFQTPDRANGPMTDDKPTTMPCKSPPVEPVNTPTSKKRRLKSPPQKVDVKEELSALRGPAHTPGGARHSEGEAAGDSEDKALEKTPKQKLDSAENLTGSKRRPRASLKEKAQPLEDLTGFKELFQTPHQSKQPVTDNSIPKMLCQSPQPEPVTITPGRRHLGTPSQTLDRQEDCSALRKPQQTLGEATYSHREPEGGDRGTAVSQEALEEKPDPAEHVTARKRQPRTPKEKAQPLEDLSGFKELFQTPDHAKKPIMIDDQPPTIPCKSPAESVSRTGRKKQLRSSPEEVGVEEPSALRRPSQTPGEATCMQREAVKDEKDTKVCKKTSRQKLVSAENVTGVKSRLRNVKEKAQPMEDPARVKEPFQKPNQTEEPGNDVKIAPASHQSPPAKPITRRMTRQRRLRSPPGKVAVEEPSASIGPTQTPGDTHTEPVGKGKDIEVLKETSGQKLSPAENVTGIRIRLRTLKKKTQPLEDSASVKELFQKPDQAKEAESDVTIAPGPRPSPPAEPVTRPTSRKRRPKSSPEKVDKEEPTPTPGESTWSQPAHDEKDSRVWKENPRQKLNPAENVTGVRSRLRTLREKTQPLEDPASVKELFQDPDQAKDPACDVTTIPMPRQSPPTKPVTRPTSRKRRIKSSPEKVDVERPSARRDPTRTPREATHSAPVRDEKDNRVLKEDSKQKLNPAENVIGVRSRLRTLREKTQPLEDPAGVKEPFQRRDGAKEPVSDVTMAPAPRQSPPAQPVTRRTGRQRQLRSPPGKAAVDEPSALSRPAQTPGEATHTEPVGNENKIEMAKETSRRSPDSAENVIGVRSRRKAFKETTVEDPARFQEPFQKPDQAKELESDAAAVKRAPKQTADRRPVETSRRALRARKVRFPEDLVGSREPAKLPGESCVSPSPERGQGEDGKVTGRKRLRPVTAAQDPEDERPLQKKQRTAPGETRESPSPSGVKKRSLRTLAQRTEPVGNLPYDDLKTKAADPQGEVAQAPNKGVSLRSRRPAKTSVEEQRPEVLISAEKVKIKRSQKKSVQTSQEMKLQSPEDGAEKSASGGKVEERRTRSRPGRQNQTPLPEAAEEKAREGRVDIPVKKQEEKEGTGHSDSKGSRSRKVSVRPPGNPSESASEQRATRSAKRCDHSLQKESDSVCVKKIRTRSRRDPEDI